ncbi:uncharacterized protein LY89DRAFT_685798 [Mollisia scopiformis]|uniref:WW domain-containing protein n=1 Tax=Mollisia scopiformis TaxID=149040 RepID=A0A194X6V2_MOLSC|nr:uncharacterized protein LY89DRAFT_685798 [Mollisia scopiformis]KUJ15905.1 hypothetical protein LY89DRAFT_685798 [Mollisia scopiformis]
MSSETASLGPLPDGWEQGRYSTGKTFWTNSTSRIKTYYDPRKPNPHPDGFEATPVEGAPLPDGWEIISRTVDGRKHEVFLDHNTHTSTSVDPRLGPIPLPEGWEAGRNSLGQDFWTNAEQRLKTYYDPRKDNVRPGGFAPVPVEGDPLPEGWEVVGKEVDGRRVVSYLDHINHRSTSEDPRG